MARAGAAPRAANRYVAPWWEELDGEAFRFPAARRPRIVGSAVPDERDADDAAVAIVADRDEPADAATDPRARERQRSGPITGGTRAAPSRTDARPLPATAGRPATDGRSATESRPATDGRRTVTIRGYGAERNLPVARPALRRHERPGFQPDRTALWAVVLGLFLILVAAASAHAAVVHQLVH